MRYEWSLRRFWKSWFIQDFNKLWYKYRHNMKVDSGFHGNTILPEIKKGKYYSIKRKSSIIEIIDNENGNFIRLIPQESAHGIVIETWHDKKLTSRRGIDFEKLWNYSSDYSEQL